MPDLNPFEPAKQDVQNFIARARNRVADFLKTYTTAVLLKTLLVSAVAVIGAALNFPLFAFVAVTVAIVSLAVYAIYATRLLKAQDREARWGYVESKRARQREAEAKIAVNSVTLALMGEGERRAAGAVGSAYRELHAALAKYQQRLRLAEQRADAAEAVEEGTATDAQRRALKTIQRGQIAPVKGPAVEPIKARVAALRAERAELEAEIQSLSTAEDINKAMRAEEVEGARRTRRERQKDARKADQAARERVRAGHTPTAREPEHVLKLQVAANGVRTTGTGRGRPTPEQIAKGEGVS